MNEITRFYNSADNAERAVARLRWEGFTDDLVAYTPPMGQERRWKVSVRPAFGMGRVATEALDRFSPIGSSAVHASEWGGDFEAISRLSSYKSPGAISSLSRFKSPGAISGLSRSRSPGAISTLSRWKSPGAISRLSRWKSPGAISRLSRTSPDGSISRLSAGWHLSSVFGLPLLTQSQGPIEPDNTLLTGGDRTMRSRGAR